jgi:oligopeptide transport system substrate-binding protein
MKHYRICWSIIMVWAFFESLLSGKMAAQVVERAKDRRLAQHQHITIGNGMEVQSLDPHKTQGTISENNVIVNLLEGLLVLDRHGETIPGVATHWEQSNGGKTWTFHLRPEARWSNGDPVIATDFVFSWRRLADPKTAALEASTLIDLQLLNSFAVINGCEPTTALGIQAVDDHTLQLQLAQPHPFLVKLLAKPELLPVHRATVEQYQERWASPAHYVGNGAYRLQEWRVNEKLVLTRNVRYWDNAQTCIEEVTFSPLSNTAERLHYRQGVLAMTFPRLPDDEFSQLQKEFPREVRFLHSIDIYGLSINNRMPPFHDVRVRRALALAIDRDLFAQHSFMQGQTLAYTMVPDGVEGVKAPMPAWATWPQDRRNREAQKLLQEMGYTAQHPLEFTLLYSTSELSKQMMLAVSTLWQKNLPVKITLENQEWKTYLEALQFGRYQVARWALGATYNEPYALLERLRSHSEQNYPQYRSQLFDTCLEGILLANDERLRQEAYRRAQEQLSKDLPIIPLLHSVEFRLVKPNVGGISGRNRMPTIYIKDLYINEQ